MQIEGVFEVGN